MDIDMFDIFANNKIVIMINYLRYSYLLIMMYLINYLDLYRGISILLRYRGLFGNMMMNKLSVLLLEIVLDSYSYSLIFYLLFFILLL